jgi:hypothetical protein
LERAIALLALSGLNALASFWLWFTKRLKAAATAIATAMLMVATLFFTDWGLSSLQPVVRVAWPLLIAASIAQLLAIGLWFLSVPPPPSSRPPE